MATAFVFPGSFPFCVTDLSGGIGSTYDYIGNITKADAMAFVWNLEWFHITTAGSATVDTTKTTSASGHLAMNDSATGRNMDADPPVDGSCNDGVWFDSQATTAWASWPVIKQPVDRVCYGSTGGKIQDFYADISGGYISLMDIEFYLSTDPSNAGKYRIYYRFHFEFENGADVAPTIIFANPGNNSGTVIDTGTFTLGGFTFDWEVTDLDTADTTSGLNMSATSGFFTY